MKTARHPETAAFIRFCFLLAVAIVLLTPPSVLASEALTLDQCLVLAAELNPDIAQAQKAGEEAAFRLQRARAEFFPELGITASAGYISEVSRTQIDDMTMVLSPEMPPVVVPAREIEIGDENQRDLALTLRQPLFTGGGIKNGVRLAAAAVTASDNQLALQKRQIRARVVRAFYELAMAQNLKSIAQAADKQIDSHLADARNLLAQGMIINSDLYPIEIRKLQTKLKIVQADNAIARARAALAAVMGLSPDTPVDIIADPDDLPPWPLPAELAGQPTEREEQTIIRSRIDMAEAEEKIARAARLPSLGLTAATHYGWPGFKGNDPDWQAWWQAGVALSWNIFDMGRRGHAQRAARAEVSRLEKEKQAVDSRVTLDRINTRLAYEEACRLRIIEAEKVLSARANYQTKADNFRVGMASGTDYLDAHTELTTAETDLSMAAARVHIAWADLLRAMGIDEGETP